MSRKKKIASLIIIDIMIIFISNFFTYVFLQPFVQMDTSETLILMLFQMVLYVIFGFTFKVFMRINRMSSFREVTALMLASSCTFLGTFLLSYLFSGVQFSRHYEIMVFFLTTFLLVLSRLTWRSLVHYIRHRRYGSPTFQNVLIVGAGAAGAVLTSSIYESASSPLHVVGYVDDDKNKKGLYFFGKKVLGTTKDLPALVADHQIDMITIAIPSIKKKDYQRIVDIITPLHVKMTTLPFIEELANGKISTSKIRDIDVVDVLGRDEIKLDMENISEDIKGKVILITGAGGTIGSEICRQILPFKPRMLLLLGHGENSIYQIHRELKGNNNYADTEIIPIIADIQDRQRIDEVMKMYHPQIIYHAAAHKHVPMMQCNPTEAVKNNIFGTKNVAELAKENQVEKFVMISTDKAVNPPNVMGATKRIAEMIVTGLNEPGKTKFVAVRFGNVLGSRGSVIPLFKEQIANGGPITVTDFRMTRYFMTIPEASRLVIQAGALAKGGEIFILDMGESVKIVDLAKKMIELSGLTEEDIKIVEVGIRPGEKLHETLLVDKEKNPQQVHEKIFTGSVNGFPLEKIEEFIYHLPVHDEEELTAQLLMFARESSK